MICTLCPRRCGVDRATAKGYCGAGELATVARAELHFWEEPVLCAGGASGAVFFSSCNLGCVYCQNCKISRKDRRAVDERNLNAAALADVFKNLEDEGAENIDLVTPTPYVNVIMDALDLYRPAVPVVYNCGGYEEAGTIKRLNGYVDIYLPDFKYFFADVAARYSNAPDYPEAAKAAILEMRRQVKDEIRGEMMKKGLIVRHLVLPTQLKNTFAVIDWVADALGKDTYFSLMSQYLPCGEAERFPEINRRLLPLEYKAAVARAWRKEMYNTFVQEQDSASEGFIPQFLR